MSTLSPTTPTNPIDLQEMQDALHEAFLSRASDDTSYLTMQQFENFLRDHTESEDQCKSILNRVDVADSIGITFSQFFDAFKDEIESKCQVTSKDITHNPTEFAFDSNSPSSFDGFPQRSPHVRQRSAFLRHDHIPSQRMRDLEETVEQQKRALEQAEVTKDQQDFELGDLRQRVKTLEFMKDHTTEECISAQSRNRELQMQCERLVAELDDAKCDAEELRQLKDVNERLCTENEQMKKECKELEDVKDKLLQMQETMEVDVLVAPDPDIRPDDQLAHDLVGQMKAEVAAMKKECKEMEDMMKSNSKQMHHFKQQGENDKQMVAELKQTIGRLTAKIHKLERTGKKEGHLNDDEIEQERRDVPVQHVNSVQMMPIPPVPQFQGPISDIESRMETNVNRPMLQPSLGCLNSTTVHRSLNRAAAARGQGHRRRSTTNPLNSIVARGFNFIANALPLSRTSSIRSGFLANADASQESTRNSLSGDSFNNFM